MISDNTILNMDCFGGFKLLPDKSVDCVFTSPPYNRVRNDTYEHFTDISKDYLGMLTRFTNECLRVSKGNVIVNIQANHFNKSDVFKYIGEFAEKIKGIVVWEKTNPQPATNFKEDTFSVTNAYEFFFVLGGGV